MGRGPERTNSKKEIDVGLGCLIVVLIVVAGGIIGYFGGLWFADERTSGGLDALLPIWIGTIGGALAGALIALVLVFGRRR